MMGVNVDKLDMLIKKNNSYLDSYNNNTRRLVDCINELNTCYNGSGLEYLFSEPKNQIKNIQFIPSIVENYSNILFNVKTSYQQQDLNLTTQINHINSKLQ